MKAENETIIDVLLKKGADVNAQDNQDTGFNSPLHLATERNMYKTVQKFLNNGGNPEFKNQMGFTCLHIAARNGYLELVKILRNYSADIENIRDAHGFTASYWAHQNGFSEIVQALPPPQKVTKEEYYEYI